MKTFVSELLKGLGIIFVLFILFRIWQQEGFLVFMLISIIIILLNPEYFKD